LTSSFVFIDIPGSFVEKLLSAVSFQLSAGMSDGADSEVWGLRCPEGIGQGSRYKLTDLRLRRIADVQKQRLRQPEMAIFCFHRHSRFVPSIFVKPAFRSAPYQVRKSGATHHPLSIVAYVFGFVKRQQVPLYSLI